MTDAEELSELRSQFNALSIICVDSLKALPRVEDPGKQPRVRDLPAQITAVVDLFERVASDLEMPKGFTILDLPGLAAQRMAELKKLRALQTSVSNLITK